MNKKMVFTIDVEDWYHAENLRPYLNSSFSKSSSSTLQNTYKILDFLDQKDAKGTFFFLGCIALNNKALVKETLKRGHEIASHGLDHSLLWDLSEKETIHDISESTKIIEDIAGTKIIGYRSPCFSQNSFITNALRENGYQYTSMSIESTFHDRYSSNYFESSENLYDFPMPVAKFGPLNIVSTGGGWFRFFPSSVQKKLIEHSKLETKVFYCHPWDFGENFFTTDKIPFMKKFRHTVGVKQALKKLNNFDFSSKNLSDIYFASVK